MKRIEELSLTRLSNGAHFTFMESIVEHAKGDAIVAAKTATLTAALETALAKEDECLKLSTKNFKSDEIAEADRERDNLYTSYKMAVEAFRNMPVKELAESAKILAQHIKDYNINTKAQLDKESGMLTNLVADLEGKYAAHVKALALTEMVTGLKAANDRVKSLIVDRDADRIGLQVGAMRGARAKTDEAYHALADMVNALAMVFGDNDYAPFIDYTNVLITRYKREALGQKSDAPDTTPGSGDGGETGGDTPGTGGGNTGGGGNTPGTGGDTGDDDGGTSFD